MLTIVDAYVGARRETGPRFSPARSRVPLAGAMTSRELALRRFIMGAFAATGAPPAIPDRPALRALAEEHVVVLEDGTGGGGGRQIRMAHPFASHREGARVDADDRTWWGNCAWDGLGIVAALGLTDATVTAQGIAVQVRAGRIAAPETALFHIAVPARHWWVDIGFT